MTDLWHSAMLPPLASWVAIAVVTLVAFGILFKNLPWVLEQMLSTVRAVAAFGPSVKLAWRTGARSPATHPAGGLKHPGSIAAAVMTVVAAKTVAGVQLDRRRESSG